MAYILPFFVQWAITALCLWLADRLFKGLKFDSARSLIIAALLLGLANAVVRPILVVLTLPLTVLTFGLFLLVINALMLLLVARLVRGFSISGFGTAVLASLFIAVLSLVIGAFVDFGEPGTGMQLPKGTVWL
jgi:putative membrane protein